MDWLPGNNHSSAEGLPRRLCATNEPSRSDAPLCLSTHAGVDERIYTPAQSGTIAESGVALRPDQRLSFMMSGDTSEWKSNWEGFQPPHGVGASDGGGILPSLSPSRPPLPQPVVHHDAASSFRAPLRVQFQKNSAVTLRDSSSGPPFPLPHHSFSIRVNGTGGSTLGGTSLPSPSSLSSCTTTSAVPSSQGIDVDIAEVEGFAWRQQPVETMRGRTAASTPYGASSSSPLRTTASSVLPSVSSSTIIPATAPAPANAYGGGLVRLSSLQRQGSALPTTSSHLVSSSELSPRSRAAATMAGRARKWTKTPNHTSLLAIPSRSRSATNRPRSASLSSSESLTDSTSRISSSTSSSSSGSSSVESDEEDYLFSSSLTRQRENMLINSEMDGTSPLRNQTGCASRGKSRKQSATVGRGRRAATKSGRQRTKNIGRKGSRGSVVLELSPDGKLYDYRWYMKRGRRVFVYNNTTYTGPKAHKLWEQVKKREKLKVPANPSSQSIHAKSLLSKKKSSKKSTLTPPAVSVVSSLWNRSSTVQSLSSGLSLASSSHSPPRPISSRTPLVASSTDSAEGLLVPLLADLAAMKRKTSPIGSSSSPTAAVYKASSRSLQAVTRSSPSHGRISLKIDNALHTCDHITPPVCGAASSASIIASTPASTTTAVAAAAGPNAGVPAEMKNRKGVMKEEVPKVKVEVEVVEISSSSDDNDEEQRQRPAAAMPPTRSKGRKQIPPPSSSWLDDEVEEDSWGDLSAWSEEKEREEEARLQRLSDAVLAGGTGDIDISSNWTDGSGGASHSGLSFPLSSAMSSLLDRAIFSASSTLSTHSYSQCASPVVSSYFSSTMDIQNSPEIHSNTSPGSYPSLLPENGEIDGSAVSSHTTVNSSVLQREESGEPLPVSLPAPSPVTSAPGLAFVGVPATLVTQLAETQRGCRDGASVFRSAGSPPLTSGIYEACEAMDGLDGMNMEGMLDTSEEIGGLCFR